MSLAENMNVKNTLKGCGLKYAQECFGVKQVNCIPTFTS
jgi:hypothetical protein